MKFTLKQQELYDLCRKSCVASIPIGWSTLRFSGKDHRSFLQGQTTNDVLSLKDGQGQSTAVLDPKAKIRAVVYLLCCSDSLYMVLPSPMKAKLQEHFEKYAVMDEVEITSLEYGLVSVSGPESRAYLEGIFDVALTPHQLFEHQQLSWNGESIPLMQFSFTGENGFLFFVKDPATFYEKLNKAKALSLLDKATEEALRIEAGIPLFEQDYSNDTLLPETGLQTETVSYTKGCFVGQEIVARVKYRGSVNRGLTGLIFDDEAPQIVGDFQVRGQKAGILTSLAYSPFLKKSIAMAYVNKMHRTPGTRINIECHGATYKATVTLLPFYQRRSEIAEAEELYHKAMELFCQSSEEDSLKAEPLLKQAIRKNPKLADAYETLGVLLSRHERFDEAINLMNQLKEINPDEVMAYSNASLYYMKKGMIKEAEDEKAAATTVTFRIAARERKQRIEEEKIHSEKEAEAKRRMGMFLQVLEIDSEDLIANFGLGKALLDFGDDPTAAIPYLEKCLHVKKDYTVAYLQLGLAYMKSGNQAQAAKIFKDGIDCARLSGDLMPGNEMERYLSKMNLNSGV